ncbi:ParA family protein, partial [Actinomadura sp. KC345]|uniref:AAA family ATPase n=1 Tax=Actinomadura sp. KC345 TaxID=2530371 RepID=UPI001052A3F7
HQAPAQYQSLTQHQAPAQHQAAAQHPPAAQYHPGGQHPAAHQQAAPAPDQRAWPVHQPQQPQQPWQGQHPEAVQEQGSATSHDHDSLPVPASGTGWPARQPALPAPAAHALEAPAKRGRVIAVASAKGGVGKTSTAVNLSVYAARHLHAAGRPGSVVLVDTNFQQADVARYLNLETPTVLDVLHVNGALSAETVRNYLAYSPDTDLHALLGPPDVIKADPALINAVLYRRILAVLRRAFDFVFVDTPVAELYHTTFTDLILPEADAILVPVEPNRVTLEAARSWLRAITMPQHSRSGGVDPEKLSLILNRARADVDCSPEDVMDLMPGWRFVGMIPEDQEWTQAANNRRLNYLQAGPDMEATFREILLSVTEDPVFATEMNMASSNGRGGLLKKILGLNPK